MTDPDRKELARLRALQARAELTRGEWRRLVKLEEKERKARAKLDRGGL